MITGFYLMLAELAPAPVLFDLPGEVLISLGTFVLGIALVDHPRFGNLLGWTGITIASVALGIHYLTYPATPEFAFLIYCGMVVWYGYLLTKLIRSVKWVKHDYPE